MYAVVNNNKPKKSINFTKIKSNAWNWFHECIHKSTRDYLARVNDPEFPKAKAATLAKKFGFDYWDGDRVVLWGYNLEEMGKCS